MHLFRLYTSCLPLSSSLCHPTFILVNWMKLVSCIHLAILEKWPNWRSKVENVSFSVLHNFGTTLFIQCAILFVDGGILRPEKDHATQLTAFHRLLKAQPDYVEKGTGMKLVLLGGSRNSGDEARVEGLRRLARDLGIEVGPSQLNSRPSFLIVACPLNAESCSICCQCALSRNARLALSSKYWAQHHG